MFTTTASFSFNKETREFKCLFFMIGTSERIVMKNEKTGNKKLFLHSPVDGYNVWKSEDGLKLIYPKSRSVATGEFNF